MNRRRPLSSKKAMPKPSLCSSARVARPVKENITSVGVLAFMPSNWHMQRYALRLAARAPLGWRPMDPSDRRGTGFAGPLAVTP